MVIVWGQRMYGRIDKNAGSYLATRFFHIYYLPLIPLSSWLVLEDRGAGNFLGVQVKMQMRSVLAAWLRIFGTVYFVATCALCATAMNVADTGFKLATILKLVTVGAIVGFAWLKLGKLSAMDRLARFAYFEHAGRFVDPALLEDRGAIKARATEQLEKQLARHVTATYRDAPTDWKTIATRPDMRDVPLLMSALTRCRIEAAEAQGPARGELEKVHATILVNLAAAKPDFEARVA